MIDSSMSHTYMTVRDSAEPVGCVEYSRTHVGLHVFEPGNACKNVSAPAASFPSRFFLEMQVTGRMFRVATGRLCILPKPPA